MSEFITIKLTATKPKTNVYEVCNKKNGYYLGEIKWHGPWRQYCFFPDGGTLYERKCLKAIVDFIDELMEIWKKHKKALKGQKKISEFNKKRYVRTESKEKYELGRGHIID